MLFDEYMKKFKTEISCIYLSLRMIENWFDNNEEKNITDFIKKFETISKSCEMALKLSNFIEDIITSSDEFFTLMQLRLREIHSCSMIAIKSLNSIEYNEILEFCYYDDLSQILLKWIKKVQEYSLEIPKYK